MGADVDKNSLRRSLGDPPVMRRAALAAHGLEEA